MSDRLMKIVHAFGQLTLSLRGDSRLMASSGDLMFENEQLSWSTFEDGQMHVMVISPRRARNSEQSGRIVLELLGFVTYISPPKGGDGSLIDFFVDPCLITQESLEGLTLNPLKSVRARLTLNLDAAVISE